MQLVCKWCVWGSCGVTGMVLINSAFSSNTHGGSQHGAVLYRSFPKVL